MSTHSIVALIMLTRSLPPRSPPASPSSRTMTSGLSSAIAASAALPSVNARTGMSARSSSATAAWRVSSSSSSSTTDLRAAVRIGESVVTARLLEGAAAPASRDRRGLRLAAAQAAERLEDELLRVAHGLDLGAGSCRASRRTARAARPRPAALRGSRPDGRSGRLARDGRLTHAHLDGAVCWTGAAGRRVGQPALASAPPGSAARPSASSSRVPQPGQVTMRRGSRAGRSGTCSAGSS